MKFFLYIGVLAGVVLGAVSPACAQTGTIDDLMGPALKLTPAAELELVAPDIIDSQEYIPTIINADGKTESLPLRTKYFYAGDQVDATVHQEGRAYANSEVLPDGRIRIFTGDAFVYDPATTAWRSIETAETDPAVFEAVMQAETDPSLGDLLSLATVAHAQDIFYPSSDRLITKGFCNSWSECRDGGGPDYGCTSTTADRTGVARNSTIWLNARTFLSFDLSSVDNEITAASFRFDSGARDNAPVFHLIEATSNSCDPNSFYNVEWTSFGSVSVDADSQETITLNQDGLDYLNAHVGGTVHLAVVEDHEVTNTNPTVDQFQRAVLKMSDQSGTDHDPALTLTISTSTPAATSTPVATTPNYVDFTQFTVIVLCCLFLFIFLMGVLYAVWPTVF